MADRKLKPSEQRRIDQQQALLEAIRRLHEHRVEEAKMEEAGCRHLLGKILQEARKRGGA